MDVKFRFILLLIYVIDFVREIMIYDAELVQVFEHRWY